MNGARKEEACGKLGTSVPASLVTQFMRCGGAFPKAYTDAKAYCRTGGARGTSTTAKSPALGSGSGSDILCDIAKMQVRLYLSVKKKKTLFCVRELQICARELQIFFGSGWCGKNYANLYLFFSQSSLSISYN